MRKKLKQVLKRAYIDVDVEQWTPRELYDRLDGLIECIKVEPNDVFIDVSFNDEWNEIDIALFQ